MFGSKVITQFYVKLAKAPPVFTKHARQDATQKYNSWRFAFPLFSKTTGKEPLKLLDSGSIEFTELWWVPIHRAQSLLNLASWCYQTWEKGSLALLLCIHGYCFKRLFSKVIDQFGLRGRIMESSIGLVRWHSRKRNFFPKLMKSLIPQTCVVGGRKQLLPSCTMIMCIT